MELKGRFNSKMIKKAKFGDVYFDDMGGFQSLEKDKVTGGVSLSTDHTPIYTNIFILIFGGIGYYSYRAHLEGIT